MPPDVTAGTIVGGAYTILEPLASGAAGAVYRARDDEAGIEVALKRLIDPLQSIRFGIEARLLERLDHPRVVAVHGHFRERSGSYLVMDLVDGPDLVDVIVDQGDPGIPVDDAIIYVGQACEALAYVHEQGVVHRDVKPPNLILGEQGVVLVDFGVAREYSGLEEGTIAVGTPRFMAPEILAGGMISPAADVYGLAATLWTLIAGRPPEYADPAPLSEHAEGVPPELDAAVRAGLDLDPHQRIASAEAFARAIGAPFAAAGAPLALSVERARMPRPLLETIVRTAAGVCGATAASLAFRDGEELVYEAAWGAGADEIVGIRLPAGTGIAHAVATSGEPVVVPDCHADARFAASVAEGTGYVPHTMMVVPVRRHGEAIGVISILDRSDGQPYGAEDLPRAEHVTELALAAIDAVGRR